MNLKSVPILLLMAIALGSTMASLQADDWSMRGRDIFRRSWVVGDTLYVTDEDGDVEILRASARYELIARINHDQPIESSPVYADETLYIVTRGKVFAIGK